jgi:hypothetical protein
MGREDAMTDQVTQTLLMMVIVPAAFLAGVAAGRWGWLWQ